MSSVKPFAAATRAANRLLNWTELKRKARLIAAAIPVGSAAPCDYTTVPFKPKKTPPLTRRGSV